ncbi:MAG: O-antigen ligase family protein [Bacteroidetes bacterium]|nr:O-antigen ligase family protein [Bacteroidota bacterium]
MKTRLQNIRRDHLATFLCGVLIIGLIYSPYLLSVSMFMLTAVSVFHIEISPRFRFGLHPAMIANVRSFLKNKAFLVITIYFFIVLLSGVMTYDFDYWLERLRLKLPFLLLPFVFVSIPSFSRRQYFGLLYFLVVVLVISCIGIGVNYWMYFEEINQLILQGQVIPTPRNHIRFSLILALGIVAGFYLYQKNFSWKYAWERKLLFGMTTFLFLFIHVLSVRSGLMALYAAIFVLCLSFIYQTRRYLMGGLILLSLLLLPFLAYKTIPSFKSKIDYVRYDLKMYKEGKGGIYSDSGRITSLKAGLKIAKKSPLFGVGAGNLQQEVLKIYASDYPEIPEPKKPHNQLLSVFAGMGIIGLLLFLFAFFYPLYHQKNYRDSLFLAFHVIVFSSFMTENTIENSIGIGFFAFFLLLGLNYLEGQIVPKSFVKKTM